MDLAAGNETLEPGFAGPRVYLSFFTKADKMKEKKF